MATYIATDNGWLGKEKGFILKGDTFEWDGPAGSWMLPVGEVTKEEPPSLDRKAIIQELDVLNIAYFKGAKTEALKAILDEALRAQGKAA